MAYSFSTQIIGSVKINLVGEKDLTINGVNGRLDNADTLIEGLNAMYDLVGGQIPDVKNPVIRSKKEDVIKDE